MRFVGWLFGGLLLILIGWIGGPVAMASYRVATAPDPKAARYAIANALLEAQKPTDPGMRRDVAKDANETAIRACGYDPQVLLRDEKVPFLLSADWGTEVVRRRSATDFDRIVRENRATYLADRYPVVTLSALIECLGTPLAPFCRKEVDRMTAAADGAGAKKVAETEAFAREQDQRILCNFLDGAAARRGIAKAAPAPPPAP